jgi:hypothetical protein
MRNLRIPESVQNWVVEYYEEKNLTQYVKNDELFDWVGTSLADAIKMY